MLSYQTGNHVGNSCSQNCAFGIRPCSHWTIQVFCSQTSLTFSRDIQSSKVSLHSQAVLVDKTLYVSGQLGLDTATGALVPGGVEAEAKRALDNMGHILQAAGISYNNGTSSGHVGLFLTEQFF